MFQVTKSLRVSEKDGNTVLPMKIRCLNTLEIYFIVTYVSILYI